MRRQIVMYILLVLAVGWSNAQNPPAEVMAVMKDYVKDSTSEWGFLIAKSWIKDSTIKASDIVVGRPIQKYEFQYEMLDTCSDSIPFNELIKPSDAWIFPISAKGMYLYKVIVTKYEGKWHISQMGELPVESYWKQLRKTYPESKNINPVFLESGSSQFLYFPQKGKRNLYCIPFYRENDPIEKFMKSSIDVLDEAGDLIKYLKKERAGVSPEMKRMIHKIFYEEKKEGDK